MEDLVKSHQNERSQPLHLLEVGVSGPPLVSAVNLRTPVELENGLAIDIAVEAVEHIESKHKKEFVISNSADLTNINNFA